jgi:hypothetical protein
VLFNLMWGGGDFMERLCINDINGSMMEQILP